MHSKNDLSIIIPVGRGDELALIKTLSSLKKQKTKYKFEILVIKDKENKGSYAARNVGIGKSNSKYLAFIDCGTLASEDWVELGCRLLVEHDYVGGKIVSVGGSWILNQYANNREFAVKEFMLDHHFAPTTNLFVRKSVLDKVGMFDQRLKSSGDMEVGRRICDAGFSQYYSDNLIVLHPTRTFKGYLKKLDRIAKGRLDLSVLYPDRYAFFALDTVKVFLPPIWLITKESWRKLPTINMISVFLTTYFFGVLQYTFFFKYYLLRIFRLY